MEKNVFHSTDSGTPQGGVCSPLLANIALHGMQQLIESEYPAYSNGTIKRSRSRFGRDDVSQPKLIRYADDLVVICDELSVVLHCRQLLENWLSNIGLELKPSKTKIVHTLMEHDGNQAGFDFLGFNIRQFPVGKHHSGKNSRQKILGFKTIIQPSNQKVKEHYQKVADKVHHLKAASQEKLINTLNPIIRGWCNYQTPWNSSQSYSQLNYLVFRLLWRWAKRRHPNKGNKWIARKYWKTIEGDNWVFACQLDEIQFKLHKHSSYPAGQRWTKVKENRSPYDGDEIYWSTRLGDKYQTKDPQKARLLRSQKGKCHHCQRAFKPGDKLEKHHLIPNSQGGDNSDDNLILLHLHCHDKVHRNHSKKGKTKASSHK